MYSTDGKHLASWAYRRLKTHAGAMTTGCIAVFARLNGVLIGFGAIAPSEAAFDVK